MSLLEVVRKQGIGTLVNYFRVAYDVVQDKDLKEVSVAPKKLKNLRLKEQFNAAAVYPDIFAKSDFVFFGDTNHTDISLHKFFYSERNIDAMADAGIKHIFPEIEPRYQPLIDRAMSGTLNERDFAFSFICEANDNDTKKIEECLLMPSTPELIERLKVTGRGARLMGERGMEVHCLDDRSNLSKEDMRAIGRFITDIKNFTVENAGFPAIMHGRILVKYLMENVQNKEGDALNSSAHERLMSLRMQDDKALAGRMLAKAGDEKAAILFGAGHAQDKKNSLFAVIGESRKATRVDLHSRADYYADRISPMKNKKARQPDYVHVLDENRLYKFKGPK